jgi:hypothetical protein
MSEVAPMAGPDAGPPSTGDESIDAALATLHAADALDPRARLDAGRNVLAVLQQRLDHLDRT